MVITGILGEEIYEVTASALIERKILAQPIIKFVPVPPMSLAMANYPTVYKEYVVENPARNKLIIDQTKALVAKKYKTLVLFRTINHGKYLYQRMQEAGIRCALVHGADSLEKRNEVKTMIEEDEIDVIVASTIAEIGWDLPIMSALVIAGSGGKSFVRANQRVGRVVRSHPGKKFAAVVEFFDQVKYLKKHALKRYEIYKLEPGFIVHPCKEMKKGKK